MLAEFTRTESDTGWTAEEVEARLVEAIEVILRTTKRPGPKLPGSAHPPIALTEVEAFPVHPRRTRDALARRRL